MSLFIDKHNTISLIPDSSVQSGESESLEEAMARGSPVTPTFDSSVKSLSDIRNANKEVRSHKRIADKIDFLICNSCFWCASCLTVDVELAIDKCPYCKESSIEYIPIAANETYLNTIPQAESHLNFQRANTLNNLLKHVSILKGD